jgi:hypothetical protein
MSMTMRRISDSVAKRLLRVDDRDRNPLVVDQQGRRRRAPRCRTKSDRSHRKSSIAKAVKESLPSTASNRGYSYHFDLSSAPSRMSSQPSRRRRGGGSITGQYQPLVDRLPASNFHLSRILSHLPTRIQVRLTVTTTTSPRREVWWGIVQFHFNEVLVSRVSS